MSQPTQITLDDFVPAAQIPKDYPGLFPEEKWKWKINQRKYNGLAKAFRKVGRDLYVNKKVLAECIDSMMAD